MPSGPKISLGARSSIHAVLICQLNGTNWVLCNIDVLLGTYKKAKANSVETWPPLIAEI